MKTNVILLISLAITTSLMAAEPVEVIQKARISGGLIAQVGSDDLSLKKLGNRFHVRLLLSDAAAVAKAQAAIDQAGLQGRFTVSAWDCKSLPFADRTLNALVVAKDGLVAEEELKRVLTPRGLLIAPSGVKTMPVPATIADWTHYLYNASGNAVSKDQEVAPPKSFRWNAPPQQLRSHNYSASFTGMVSAGGRVFHMLDEGTFLFDMGGATEKWSLVCRDAFNGALLWKRPLSGYGQPFFEDVAGQAVNDFIWRTPLSMNRRIVAQHDKVYAAFGYRHSPLTIADAATGTTLHEVKLDGVDEIVARGNLVVCRVRPEIPMPKDMFRRENVRQTQEQLKKDGVENPRGELNGRVMDILREHKNEQVVAVDASRGAILWKHDAPLVGTQSLALSDDKVVFHNYEALVALDAKSGRPVWTYPCPVQKRTFLGARNLLGNLLVADGKVLWASSATGGGVCLSLADGKELWKNPLMGTTGGFAFPTALRSVDGVVWSDYLSGYTLADGLRAKSSDIGDMRKRGHHIRCFAGRATERYLILPERGAEFIDLKGDNHMPCDWFRGACSYGLMPANGMVYSTPNPCSCYAGGRIYGLYAMAAQTPEGLNSAPAPDAPERLVKGPAYGRSQKSELRSQNEGGAWPVYRADARRTGNATCALPATLATAWNRELGGELTQATAAEGRVFLVKKNSYELFCLNLADGKTVWQRSFSAALDSPPTIVGGRLYAGCRDGRIYSLTAADGQVVWSFLAAPLERLALSDDRLESLWPVSTSIIHLNGLIYGVAGRSSYLDGGIRLCALDPATGVLRHSAVLEGPWPDKETIRTAVVTESDLKKAEQAGDPAKIEAVTKAISDEYATGYNVLGGEGDLLVSDGTDLFLTQNKFDPQLKRIPLKRTWISGFTPMGNAHMMASAGFLNDAMQHRIFMVYDKAWPSYSSGPGSAARGGSLVCVGRNRAYAAQHYEGGGYATHKPGAGNRIVADALETENISEGMLKKDSGLGDKTFLRTAPPLWETKTPVIIRALLTAPDKNGGELVFAAGIVEGKTLEEWDRSTYYIGPGKLQVFNGADGKLLAEYDLPACPVYDGMSAADGKLLIPMVNGQIHAMKIKP